MNQYNLAALNDKEFEALVVGRWSAGYVWLKSSAGHMASLKSSRSGDSSYCTRHLGLIQDSSRVQGQPFATTRG